MRQDLIRRFILNGTAPTYDGVYQNALLMLGFLVLTILVEAAGFWILYRKKAAKDAEFPLYDMLCWIVVLNIITFFIGGIIYLSFIS